MLAIRQRALLQTGDYMALVKDTIAAVNAIQEHLAQAEKIALRLKLPKDEQQVQAETVKAIQRAIEQLHGLNYV